MVEHYEWRLQNAEGLEGQKFRWKTWRQPSESWDHDHCAGCWAMFCLHESCQSLKEGYAITEDYKLGEDYKWVCPECFEALKDALGWTVAPPCESQAEQT